MKCSDDNNDSAAGLPRESPPPRLEGHRRVGARGQEARHAQPEAHEPHAKQSGLHEEFTRLAETRLAQNTIHYLKIAVDTPGSYIKKSLLLS